MSLNKLTKNYMSNKLWISLLVSVELNIKQLIECNKRP